MDIYEIYSDASWDEQKLKESVFGACVVYKNGNIIYQKGKRIKNTEGIHPETKNIIRSINIFKDNFLSQVNAGDVVIFKTDGKCAINYCNKALKFVSDGNKINHKIIAPIKAHCIQTLAEYAGLDIRFQWIPRDDNWLADKIANDSKEEFMARMCLEESSQYMRDDLEYTISKWKKWFKDDSCIDITDKLQKFIDINL